MNDYLFRITAMALHGAIALKTSSSLMIKNRLDTSINFNYNKIRKGWGYHIRCQLLKAKWKCFQ